MIEESNKTVKGQFIKDKKLGLRVRQILSIYDKWELRGLEKEILTLLIYNQLMLKKSTERTINMTNMLVNDALPQLQGLSNRGEGLDS